MSRSRAFNRFHRWTAKVRRSHLKAWLPDGHAGDGVLKAASRHRKPDAARRDAMQDINEFLPLDEDVPIGA